eukprot:365942-Chlamydomonas_euryale.AAC.16
MHNSAHNATALLRIAHISAAHLETRNIADSLTYTRPECLRPSWSNASNASSLGSSSEDGGAPASALSSQAHMGHLNFHEAAKFRAQEDADILQRVQDCIASAYDNAVTLNVFTVPRVLPQQRPVPRVQPASYADCLQCQQPPHRDSTMQEDLLKGREAEPLTRPDGGDGLLVQSNER